MNYVTLGKGRIYKSSGEESRSTLAVVPDENNNCSISVEVYKNKGSDEYSSLPLFFERQTTNYLFNFVLSFSINPFKSFQVYKVV
ncbi:hypothetical protein LH29_16600 [Draconibacterium sediminis]|uniref:Uncharacterized protein n=1 Tax=Draconibacterium sediminis TaxID=1544798 RepID=A0A0D8JB28_9BACT|nr:hypothetical protein LH29_16600 [Draconibacterium sediminis]